MKKISKTIAKALIALTFFIPMSAELVGCELEPVDPKPGIEGTLPEENKQEDKNQTEEDRREEEEEKSKQEKYAALFKAAKDKYNDFFSKIGTNFEYKMYKDDTLQNPVGVAAFSGTFVRMEQLNGYDDGVRYYSNEDGKDYIYYLQGDEWHRRPCGEDDITVEKALKVVETFGACNWISLDEKTGMLVGDVTPEYEETTEIKMLVEDERAIIYIENQVFVIDNVEQVKGETLPTEYIEDSIEQEFSK